MAINTDLRLDNLIARFGPKTMVLNVGFGGVTVPTGVGSGGEALPLFPLGTLPKKLEDIKLQSEKLTADDLAGGLKSEAIDYGNGNTNRQNKLNMFGRPMFMPIEIDGFVLWNEPIPQAERRKTIISSRPVAPKGSNFVNEVAGIGPWEIQLAGFILSDYKQIPTAGISKLASLQDSVGSLKIASVFTDALNVHAVIIENVRIFFVPGYQGKVLYVMTVVQDTDFFQTITNRG